MDHLPPCVDVGALAPQPSGLEPCVPGDDAKVCCPLARNATNNPEVQVIEAQEEPEDTLTADATLRGRGRGISAWKRERG